MSKKTRKKRRRRATENDEKVRYKEGRERQKVDG